MEVQNFNEHFLTHFFLLFSASKPFVCIKFAQLLMCHDPEEGSYPKVWSHGPHAPLLMLVYDVILPLWEIQGWIINFPFPLGSEKYELRKRQTNRQFNTTVIM